MAHRQISAQPRGDDVVRQEIPLILTGKGDGLDRLRGRDRDRAAFPWRRDGALRLEEDAEAMPAMR